jgi:hypothetical protein
MTEFSKGMHFAWAFFCPAIPRPTAFGVGAGVGTVTVLLAELFIMWKVMNWLMS